MNFPLIIILIANSPQIFLCYKNVTDCCLTVPCGIFSPVSEFPLFFTVIRFQEAYEQFCKIEIPLKKEKKEEQEEKEETFTFNSDHMNEVMAQYQIEVGQYKPIKLKEEDVKGIFKFFKKHRQKKEQQRVDKINQAAVDTAMDLAAKKIEQQYAENPQELQPVIDSLEKKYQAYIDRSEQYSKAYETKEKEDIVENDQELEVKDENKDTRKIKFPEKAVSIIKKARKKNELKERKKRYRVLSRYENE